MPDSLQPHRRQPTRLPRPWDSPGKNTGVGCHFLLQCMKVKSESEKWKCPTLHDPMDCSLPGSSVHGIFQARVLEWGAIAFSDICVYVCVFALYFVYVIHMLEKAMAPHSSTLAWKIPWTEEPGRLQSMGLRSQTRLSNFTFTFHFHALEKEMATHSSVLAWRIPGTAEPGGLPSMGSHRVGHDWSDFAAGLITHSTVKGWKLFL